jgi:hypothetical protein
LTISLGGSLGSPNYSALALGNPSNLSGTANAAGAYADTTVGAAPGIFFAGGESITGLTAGLEQAGSPSSRSVLTGSGSQGAATDAGQTPVFCPQLAFQPLVAGCEALSNPITGGGLAETGLPILIGLTGLLVVGAGWLLYVRSRAADPVTGAIAAVGIAAAPRRRGLGAIARTLAVQRLRR